MKKILILSNLAWMLIAIMIMANANSHTPKASVVNEPPPTCDPGSVAFMSPDAFLKGIARYRKYQLNAINKDLSGQGFMNGNFEDARSCWYSIDELQSFICLTKQKAKENGFNTATTEMGIRFYYAAYPEAEKQTVIDQLDNPQPGKINFIKHDVNVGMHHTLFMVPTVQDNETKLDEPIFLNVLPRPGNEQPIRLKKELALHPKWESLIKDSQVKILVLGQAATPSSANQGGLCPPHCPPPPKSLLTKADALYPDNTINQH